MTKVIIIEDDPMVAAINKQYLEKSPGMNVVATFHNGKDAWDFLQQKKIDLILLDLFMPEMTGLEFLSLIRQHKRDIDVIMVTAANNMEAVKEAMLLGILDYLVKPFEYERFRLAIEKYQMKHKLLDSSVVFTQEDVDSLVSLSRAKESSVPKEYQKGIQEATLRTLLECLQKALPSSLTSEELARETNLSKVTVRRYMNYLIESNRALSEIDYKTGGRPRIHYKAL
ncbi:MAG: response regulator [Hespellia sp.]|nr:response regulator [Hespellia sp.]